MVAVEITMTTIHKSHTLTPHKLARHIYSGITADGSNIGCVVSDDGAICIDLPHTAAETLAWRSELALLTLKPIKSVIFTSPDRFSSEALGALATGKLRMPTLLQDAGHHTLLSALEASYPHPTELGLPFHVREQAGLPEITFSDHATVTLGGSVDPIYVDVTHVGGCAPGASYVTVRDSGILFVGDHIAVGEAPLFSAGDLDKWIKALTGLARFKNIKTVVPGRGAITNASAGEAMVEFVKSLKSAMTKFNRRDHAREDLAALVPELAAQFEPKRRTRGDLHGAEDINTSRIRTGLEAIFDAQRKETQAIIV